MTATLTWASFQTAVANRRMMAINSDLRWSLWQFECFLLPEGVLPIWKAPDKSGESPASKACMRTLLGVILVYMTWRFGMVSNPSATANCETAPEASPRSEEAVMARVIEFHVPANFQRKGAPISQSQKGTLVEFCARTKKSA